MPKARFDWDQEKDDKNYKKHSVSFALAQLAFVDPKRVIAEDTPHSSGELRYFCFGQVGAGILTVRFTYRESIIRIHGAGYWRKGKRTYERENQVHGRTPRKPEGRS
jgi:uncharacterized DUF497 family protein